MERSKYRLSKIILRPKLNETKTFTEVNMTRGQRCPVNRKNNEIETKVFYK